MDPRTFLRPPAQPTPPAPGPGEMARSLPLELEQNRPAVVAFLRHTGCPFAELTMQMLREAATRSPEVQWIAISHAPAQATAHWCRAVGGSDGVALASDPSRNAYSDWGLPRSSLAHFLGRRPIAAVGRLSRRGIRNRHPSGTRWQSAGTFALDGHGTVRWRHLPAHAGDMPDLEAALNSLR